MEWIGAGVSSLKQQLTDSIFNVASATQTATAQVVTSTATQAATEQVATTVADELKKNIQTVVYRTLTNEAISLFF